jgi:hypothetical protein
VLATVSSRSGSEARLVVKGADLAVYEAFCASAPESWQPGSKVPLCFVLVFEV